MNYWQLTRKNLGWYTLVIALCTPTYLFILTNEYVTFTWVNLGLGLLIPISIIAIISIIIYKTYQLKTEKNENQAVLDKIEGSEKNKLVKQLNDKDAVIKNLEKGKQKKEPTYKRFEDIVKRGRNKFMTLSIDYDPFFYEDRTGQSGIGHDLIQEIFRPFPKIKFEKYTDRENNTFNWDGILKALDDRKNNVDLLLTPLYETRTRLYKHEITFSTPIFYSSFGLYMRKVDLENGINTAKILENQFDFTELKELFKRKIFNKLEFKYLKGEMSELLCSKIKGKEPEEPPHSTYKDEYFTSILEEINDIKPEEGKVIFMEVFKAEKIRKDKKLNNIVNILKPHSLVYPVGFVFRKEETVLRSFINLRILELREEGTIDKIISRNAEDYGLTDQVEIENSFIQKFDFNKIDNDFLGKILFSDNQKEEYSILEKVYGNYISFQEGICEIVNSFRSDEKLKILEIGFGTGITTKQIVNRKTNDEIIVVDNDPAMERIFREEKPQELSDDNIVTNDIFKYLKKTTKTFDIIVSGYTIHNFSNKKKLELYELIFNKMSNDSIFINADKFSPDDINDRIDGLIHRVSKYLEYLKANPQKLPLIEEWVSHYINDQREEIVMKETETKEILSEIGFKDIDVKVPRGMNKKKEMMAILTARKTE